MMDVYLRYYPLNAVREHLAAAVFHRLLGFEDIRLHTLLPVALPYWKCPDPRAIPMGPIDKDMFHITSKRYAEAHARSEIYCVIDDDHMPVDNDFFRIGEETLGNHPEYGMLTARLLIEHQPYPPFQDVFEVHAIGCPYFVRRGTLKDFPPGSADQYDGILSKVVTDQGLKTGIAQHCRCNHLGFNLSQISKDHDALRKVG